MSPRKLNPELAAGKTKKPPVSSAQNSHRLKIGGVRYLWGRGMNVNLNQEDG